MSEPRGPVLVVGRGLIGIAVADRLRAAGRSVLTVSRAADPDRTHLSRDVGSAAGRRALRADLRRNRPRGVVLAHGPSDVTWIEAHEREAAAAHVGVAELLADTGVPTVMVSTDNVFPGTRGGRRPGDPIRPANAYGRVKARAERVLLAGGNCLVLRVSMVYGWTGAGHRSTYGQRCLLAAGRGEVLRAPTDQVFTPVHVEDVAGVLAALGSVRRPVTGLAHLAGPAELSRYEFARLAYRVAGADEDLVRPCLRADTEWASRPRFSALRCDGFDHVPGLAGWRPRSPEDGLRAMVSGPPVEVPA